MPLPASGVDTTTIPGIPILALPWPTSGRGPAVRDERAAWLQVIRKVNRRLIQQPKGPWLVISHVPPRDVGDTPSDPYHVGFAAYLAVLDRLRPPLWLHGHTSRAASPVWQVERGPTTAVNVTGSVLIELLPPAEALRRASLEE